MNLSAPDEHHPFVDTSIARLMRSRLAITHEERGISVVSGPWGVGKTWAIDAFAKEYEYQCIVIKVEPGSRKTGVPPIMAMQMVLEALKSLVGSEDRSSPGNAYWVVRRQICQVLGRYVRDTWGDHTPNFTMIFDEAQYLSRETIEMLRFWNDGDRTTVPIPVGLVFVGNNEFALQENASGESVLSGAVRSRLLFQENLQYANVNDKDLSLFLQSRGIIDADAIREFITYFSRPGRTRDLRYAERQATFLKKRAGENGVSGDMVRSILNI